MDRAELLRLEEVVIAKRMADIDSYLSKLRQALESAINNDERVEIC